MVHAVLEGDPYSIKLDIEIIIDDSKIAKSQKEKIKELLEELYTWID